MTRAPVTLELTHDERALLARIALSSAREGRLADAAVALHALAPGGEPGARLRVLADDLEAAARAAGRSWPRGH